MPLTLWDIDDLINRKRDPIWVGEIPYEVAAALGLANPNVYLSRESLMHIFDEHPDLTKFALLHLPFLVRRGLLMQDRFKRRIVIGCYQDPGSHRRYKAIMKMANQRAEIWLSTYHRAHRRHTRRILQRSDILKTHD